MSGLSWHILGGNNKYHVGANSGMVTYEYEDDAGKPRRKAFLIDAGTMPGDTHLPENPALAECDMVLPDYTRFLYKANDASHKPDFVLDAIFLTHNHPDHIDALPLLIMMGYRLPTVYATPYTARRFQQELSNAGIEPADWPEISTIAPGNDVRLGPVSVRPFWVSHSTPQSVGFFVDSPEGTILHTGDFKMDQSVLYGPAFSTAGFHRAVNKPVDLMLVDSTGARHEAEVVTEGEMRDSLHEIIKKNPGKRIIVAAMSGYEENLASIAKVAADEKRTLWVAGSAHEQVIHAMQATGVSLADQIGAPLDLRILSTPRAARGLSTAAPGAGIVVVTGSQGHANSALVRAATGNHPHLALNPVTDIIVFCAPPMSGQIPLREKLLKTLRQKGYMLLTHKDMPLYSHGHARLPEIIEMVKLAAPRHVMALHGGRVQRESCAASLEKAGFKAVRADNGDVLSVTRRSVRSADPSTKDNALLTGLKVYEGSNWKDRVYLRTDTVSAAAMNDNAAGARPAPKKQRPPRIFPA